MFGSSYSLGRSAQRTALNTIDPTALYQAARNELADAKADFDDAKKRMDEAQANFDLIKKEYDEFRWPSQPL